MAQIPVAHINYDTLAVIEYRWETTPDESGRWLAINFDRHYSGMSCGVATDWYGSGAHVSSDPKTYYFVAQPEYTSYFELYYGSDRPRKIHHIDEDGNTLVSDSNIYVPLELTVGHQEVKLYQFLVMFQTM